MTKQIYRTRCISGINNEGSLLGFVWRNWLKSFKRLLFTPPKLIDPLPFMWLGKRERGGGNLLEEALLACQHPASRLPRKWRSFFFLSFFLFLQVDLRQALQWARFRLFFFLPSQLLLTFPLQIYKNRWLSCVEWGRWPDNTHCSGRKKTPLARWLM